MARAAAKARSADQVDTYAAVGRKNSAASEFQRPPSSKARTPAAGPHASGACRLTAVLSEQAASLESTHQRGINRELHHTPQRQAVGYDLNAPLVRPLLLNDIARTSRTHAVCLMPSAASNSHRSCRQAGTTDVILSRDCYAWPA